MLNHALSCLEKGWAVFPLKPNTKVPLTPHGFKDATKSADAVREFWRSCPNANIGLATGVASGIFVIDVDVKNGAKGKESLATLKGLPPTLTVSTPSGGWHLYYLYSKQLRSRNGALPGIDLKADGGYVVAPGSVIDGRSYSYTSPENPLSVLPDVFVEILNHTKKLEVSPPLISEVIPTGQRNATLARIAGSLRRQGLGADGIAAALKEVNAECCRPPLPEIEVDRIATSVARYPVEAASLEQSEDALALQFTRLHEKDWRYVAAWGSWLHYDGARWIRENTLKALDLARLVCRDTAVGGGKPKIASAATVAAVERLARADRRHAATVDQWDADPWLLNTPRGMVDLRTGAIRPHDQAAYLTRIAAAAPAGEAPDWRAFLSDVTGRDQALQSYLARLAGYALTGDTGEHAFFFLYGTGANGKSVFINTLSAVLGEYAVNASMDAFLETRSDQHPTCLAGLRGARLVTAIEVERGRRWAEAKIKSLTGGDRISARFMRQDFFEYTPQFKLLIAGNQKPSLHGVDEAMRRRLHLISFAVTIPPESRDKTLPARLLAEKDGILNWAVQGCLEWQKVGLQPPASVVSTTDEYFEAEDSLGRWVDECCDRSPRSTATTEELYGSWKVWTERQGEQSGTLKKFAEELAGRGFKRWRSSHKKGFQGLALRANETEAML